MARTCLPLLAALVAALLIGGVAVADLPGGPADPAAKLCAVLQPGVHCGLGLGRRTAGGGDKVSHRGWPAVTGALLTADDSGRTIRGGSLNDEVLGGDGSDRLYGGPGNDILWGDQHAGSRNDTRQHDVLRGGAGNDWIYTSHGFNQVYAGPGNDIVRAYYGHGTIDCGSGYDTAQVRMNGAYRLIRCEHVVHFCAFGSKADGSCRKPGEARASAWRRTG